MGGEQGDGPVVAEGDGGSDGRHLGGTEVERADVVQRKPAVEGDPEVVRAGHLASERMGFFEGRKGGNPGVIDLHEDDDIGLFSGDQIEERGVIAVGRVDVGEQQF